MKRLLQIITPADASEMLRIKNVKNKLNVEKLEKFKQLMITGKWRTDKNVFIKFRNNRLMDGHHRLIAVAETGIEQLFGIQYE